MTRIVLLGPPGVGKGTQAAELSAALRIPAISTGDIFRAQIELGSPLGAELQAIVTSGGLVPDTTTSAVVADRLTADDVADGFILDGYPRTAGQAADLDAMLEAAGTRLTRVFLLHAAEDVLMSRIARRSSEQHRADDDAAVVRARLRTYAESTAPLVELYERRGLLTRVDADRPPAVITDDLASIAREGVEGGLLA